MAVDVVLTDAIVLGDGFLPDPGKGVISEIVGVSATATSSTYFSAQELIGVRTQTAVIVRVSATETVGVAARLYAAPSTGDVSELVGVRTTVVAGEGKSVSDAVGVRANTLVAGIVRHTPDVVGVSDSSIRVVTAEVSEVIGARSLASGSLFAAVYETVAVRTSANAQRILLPVAEKFATRFTSLGRRVFRANILEAIGLRITSTARSFVSVRASVGVRGTFSTIVNPFVSERFAISVRSEPIIFAPVSDSAGVRASIDAVAIYVTHDVIGVRITAPAFARISRSILERVGVSASALSVAGAQLSETVGVSGASTQTVYRVSVVERIGARLQPTAIYQRIVTVNERWGVRSSSLAGLFGDVSESVGVRGSVPLARQIARQHVLERVGVRISVSDVRLRVFASVVERIAIRSSSVAFGRIFASLRERIFVHASSSVPFVPRLPSFYAAIPSVYDTSAWTADARSWGMSRYIGLPVSEWVIHRGLAFAASPSGVYTRAGDAPVSWIETPRLRFETQFSSNLEKKRLSNIYTYAQRLLPLDISVSGDYYGSLTEYFYTEPIGSSDATRAVRTPVGRGFASTYYQFKIGNASFDIYKFEVETVLTRRKVGA